MSVFRLIHWFYEEHRLYSITLESILFYNCYEFLTQFFKPCFDSLEFGNLRVIFMKIVGGKVLVRTLDLGEDFNIDRQV